MADNDDPTKDTGDKGGTKAPEITFPTRAAFHDEVNRKVEAAVKKAVEATSRKYLDQLEVESDDDLPIAIEAVKKGKSAISEQEKSKRELDKATKELQRERDNAAGLLKWKHTSLKQSALAKYSSRTVDMETLGLHLMPKIKINDDDSLTGDAGETLDALVDGIFKAKPFLKAPDNTPGAGTKPGAKPDGKAAASKSDEGSRANGAPKTLGGAIVNALKAQREGNP